MKNTIYAVLIGVCIIGAVVMFVMNRRGGSGISQIPDSQMAWVKCAKCDQSYEMSLKKYLKELEEKSRANPSPMPVPMPLTCQKCGQDGIRRAFKCEKCGEVSFEHSVGPNDFPDRCPKCKHSTTEAKRNANNARMGQQ